MNYELYGLFRLFEKNKMYGYFCFDVRSQHNVLIFIIYLILNSSSNKLKYNHDFCK